MRDSGEERGRGFEFVKIIRRIRIPSSDIMNANLRISVSGERFILKIVVL